MRITAFRQGGFGYVPFSIEDLEDLSKYTFLEKINGYLSGEMIAIRSPEGERCFLRSAHFDELRRAYKKSGNKDESLDQLFSQVS